MKKPDRTKKRLLKEAHEMAKDLHEAGAIDITPMREFDVLCLSEVHEMSPSRTKRIQDDTVTSSH